MSSVNFIILKINDIDVGQLPQQQQKIVLSTLLNEETENIVLELKRQSCWNANRSIDYDDIEISKKLCYLKIRHNAPLEKNTNYNSSTTTLHSDVIVNLHLPNSSFQEYCISKSTQTEDIAIYVHEHLRNIQKEQENNLFEESLAPEIEIEEITLRKSDNESLGLTVCYSNAEDYADEVYISDIHPDSVAGRDGRVRQGDQILQINGKDIKTRPETETLIAENNNAVTLLVSRYLYADDDDFNDHSTNGYEDEVLVVEEDDDDDDFYDENNMTYMNCLLNNGCCINATNELDKAFISQIVNQEILLQPDEQPKEKHNLNTTTTTVLPNPAYQSHTVKCTSSFRKDRHSKKWSTRSSNVKYGKSKLNPSKTAMTTGDKFHIKHETEHIYETIPEDIESEPFYCSPYDSSVYVTAVTSCSSSTINDTLQHLQQKQRVAKWLGITPLQGIYATTAPLQSANSTVRSAVTALINESVDCQVTNSTLRDRSQIEDRDNSSSAYNTGGSNNSMSLFTLMLNSKNGLDQTQTFTNSTINSLANGNTDNELGMQQLHQKTSFQQKPHSPKDKHKSTSPKAATIQKKINGAHKMVVRDIQAQSNDLNKITTINKDSNVLRNMLLKEHLSNQKFSLEKSLQPQSLQQGPYFFYHQQQQRQVQCPQFTAPNLSQYHFVSSQEVNNLSLNNKVPKSSTTVAVAITNNPKKDEEAMVWKVKRRPDGTRYIVRRPAKTRIIEERNTRLNVERLRNDMTTTEDDTISEIKTGRYWTKEERKKHIEKARERRLHQQVLQQQQNKLRMTYDGLTAASLCIRNVTSEEQSEQEKIKHQQHLNIIMQQQRPSHYEQHYQLQFNLAEEHKHSTPLHNTDSPTKKSSSTLPNASVEFSSFERNVDQLDVLNT